MTPAPSSSVLLVFARFPGSGPVKTRLAVSIGQEAARRVYAALAQQIWAGLAGCGLERWLLVEPAGDAAAASAWLRGADRVLGQPPGDLGARLTWAFAAAFEHGAACAMAIGTDAPAITAGRIRAAQAALTRAEVVVVPSLDGGYALLGLRSRQDTLFREVPWGTDRVLEVTRERAAGGGLDWAELEAVRDLDTAEDLQALRAEGWIHSADQE